MPAIVPIKRSDLIRYLRQLGFTGPKSGGKHEFMVKGELRLTLPKPHGSDISTGLLSKLLHQAGVSQNDWKALWSRCGAAAFT